MATEVQPFSLFPIPPVPAPIDGTLDEFAADANDSDASLTIAITDSGTDLAKKTVCIKVRLSSMGNTRKVSTAQIEADADKDLLRVSKQIIPRSNLTA